MSNKKKKKEKPKGVKEPKEGYGSRAAKKTIRFFSSFDEMEEYGRQVMADHTPEERLKCLEIMRKRFFFKQLLPNGKWPPLRRVITIVKGTRL